MQSFLLFLFIGFSSAVSICESSSGELIATSTQCEPGFKEYYGAGVNIFDAFWDGSSGMIQPGISYQDTLIALQSASISGVRYFRFFASCWGPNQIYWLTNQQQYWNEFDRLMKDIATMGFYVIPSIGYDQWDLVANQWVKGLNETKNDLVKNHTSQSFQLAMEYFSQFVARYASHDSVLFWELGNELNLLANLAPPWCGDKQCFNTAEMVNFTSALANVIRAGDPKGRPITSGFAAPRPQAWHQENCNLTDPHCDYWGLDTEDQFREMLAAQHQGMEVISVHLYGAPDACYFTPTNCANASLATIAAQVAQEENKLLFVGEYGGASPTFTGPSDDDQKFPVAMLEIQAENFQQAGAFRLSAIWAWECPSHRQDMNCIFPNSTRPTEAGSDKMLGYIQQANQRMH